MCLKTGRHTVPHMLSIARSNVKLVGESHGTIVSSLQQGTVLMIGGTAAPIEGIEISMIEFEQNPQGTPGAANAFAVVAATNVRRSAILDCGARSMPRQLSIGIQLANTEEFHIARCRIETVTLAIFASGLQTGTLFIDDNIIDLGIDTANSIGWGILLMQISGRSRIAGNSLRNCMSGIVVNGQITGSAQLGISEVIVAKNFIVCLPFEARGSNGQTFGIDLAVHSGIVSQNLLEVPTGSNANTGIRVAGDNINVVDNQIIPIPGATNPDNGFTGIQVGDGTALTNDIRVAGNFIDGCRVGISANTVTTAIVESNIVQLGDIAGNIGIWFGAVRGGQVKGSRITGKGAAIICTNGIANEVTGNTLANGNIGVSMQTETTPVIAQNRIDAMTSAGIVCALVTGRCDIVENRIASCGFGVGTGSGIMIQQIEGELHIEANAVMDTGFSPDRSIVSNLAYGIAGTRVLEASIENNHVGYTNPESRAVANEDRALTMTCLRENLKAFPGFPAALSGYPIQILATSSPGRAGPRLSRFRNRGLSINACVSSGFSSATTMSSTTRSMVRPRPQNAGTVTLFGRVATVMGNHIKAVRPSGNTPAFPSVNFNGMPGPFIGNVTSGNIVQHTQFPTPQTSFNLIV